MSLNRGNARWYAVGFFAMSFLTLSGAVYFTFLAWESHDSGDWPHVPGSIISSYSEHTCGMGKGGHTWEAKIVYRYVVDGLAHEARRVGNYSMYCESDRQGVNAWLKSHYPAGKSVEVYYNPSNPDATFLHPGQVATMDIAMIVAQLLMSGLMGWGGRMALNLLAANPGDMSIARQTMRFKFKVSVGTTPRQGATDPHGNLTPIMGEAGPAPNESIAGSIGVTAPTRGAKWQSSEEFFRFVNELIVRLETAGHLKAAAELRSGFGYLNGLTDGWALFLDSIERVRSGYVREFDLGDRVALETIRAVAHAAVYRQ